MAVRYTYHFFYYVGSDPAIHVHSSEAMRFGDALTNFCNFCVGNHYKDIFYPYSVDDKKPHKYRHVVKTKHGLYYIDLCGLEITAPGKNKYLLAMKAKRELLGLTYEQATEITGYPSYKAYELGRRLYLDEYTNIMEIFDTYDSCIYHEDPKPLYAVRFISGNSLKYRVETVSAESKQDAVEAVYQKYGENFEHHLISVELM